jgi:c-di-GMP-binding flagellar brake protein YcgR
MAIDTRQAGLERDGSLDGLSTFRVGSEQEVQSLLRQLADGSVPIHLAASDGSSYTTTLWTCDSACSRVSFSADAHHTRLERLVDADEVMAVAYLDAVKLQFDVDDLVLVHGPDGCVLQAAWPRRVYRFQRREAYRVRTLDSGSPAARLRHPSIPEMTLALRVLDVSIGGCALMLPADVPPLQPGTRIEGVRVDLDADTRFESALIIHHISALGPSEHQRLGCEWQRIAPAALRALQRYIDHIQKRRRLLSI